MRLLLLLALLPLTVSLSSRNRRDTHNRIRRSGCKRKDGIQSAQPSSSIAVSSSKVAVPSSKPKGVVAVSTGTEFNYGKDKVRGINLGGWLVLESFLTPGIFSNTGNDGIVDEWTFCQYQDRSTAESALWNHWSTFITEDDFKQIKAANLNHVRIPVGYWAWDIQGDEPFIPGSADFLDKAIGWARNQGLKVLIDLHGASGSQNGYDHSGRKGDANWYTDPNNVKRTINLIQSLSQKYGTAEYSDTVTMLELLNEPALFINDQIKTVTKQFYLDAYEVARRPWGLADGRKTDWVIVFHDGFQNLKFWNGFMTGDGYENVWIDDHYYQAFGNQYFGISAEQHIRDVCDKRDMYTNSPLPYIGGEWSIAVWGCSPAEGWFVGTCDLSGGMQDYPKFIRAYFDTQVQMFENLGKGQGWFYFNWKTEDLAEWSYQTSLQNGWLPWDQGNYQFKLDDTCNSL